MLSRKDAKMKKFHSKMPPPTPTVLLMLLFILLTTMASWAEPSGDGVEWEKILQPADAFVARELESGRTWRIHPQLCGTPELPASTFKIPNTLIGLETKAISGLEDNQRWDGTIHSVEAWNKGHDLESAFRNSVVWYYQRAARRVGPMQMQQWLDRFDYGNRDISGGIDRFWLDGGLRISPDQQVEFLSRLVSGRLSVSEESLGILRQIMEMDHTPASTLFAKTGWAQFDQANPPERRHVGWYVGYVVDPNKGMHGETLVFAFNCRSADPAPANFAPERVRRAKACLTAIGWWD